MEGERAGERAESAYVNPLLRRHPVLSLSRAPTVHLQKSKRVSLVFESPLRKELDAVRAPRGIILETTALGSVYPRSARASLRFSSDTLAPRTLRDKSFRFHIKFQTRHDFSSVESRQRFCV